MNSVHLEAPRRQDYRRARESLLRARGEHTLYASRSEVSHACGHTIIHKADGVGESSLTCWLRDGEFIYPLKVGINTLGRSGDNDVVVEDAFASRRHCAILVHANESCELHDTASKNGTYVNGDLIAGPASLKCGDEIRISHQQFIFQTRSGDSSLQATLNG